MFFVLMFLIFVPSAYAVVPGVWPFLQSLVSFLPQILLFLLIGASAIFKLNTWKRILTWLARKIRTKVGMGATAGVVLLVSSITLCLIFSGSERNTTTPALGSPSARKAEESQPGADSAFLGSPSARKTEEWPVFRGNIRRSGSIDGRSGPQDAVELWSFREAIDRAGFASSPAVVGGRVYVGANNDNLYCFSAATGDVIWKFEAGYEVFSSPAVAGERVYFGEGLHYAEDAAFHCVDSNTGEEIWSFQTTSHGESSPSVADGKVVFGAGKDGVYCLDAETGTQWWRYPSIYVAGSPVIYDRMVYFGSGYGRNGIYCLDLDDGSEIWTVETDRPAWGAPAVWDDRIYIGTGEGNFVFSTEEPDGSVMCLDARTGDGIWEFELADTVLGAIAIDNGRAYFGSRDSSFYCVDASSGEEIWSFATDGAIVSSPAVTGDDVYFGSADGKVYCLDKEDGIAKWEFDTSESGFLNVDSRIISSPAVSGAKLFVGSMNFFFYCLTR
jgi:outer membrane protein assembly factor BamB